VFFDYLVDRTRVRARARVNIKEFPTVNFPHPKDQMEAACSHEPRESEPYRAHDQLFPAEGTGDLEQLDFDMGRIL
jgi:hypothetical protein